MSNPTPTMPAIIDAVIAMRLAGVRSHGPGRIEAYDADLQKADVQPLIKEGYLEGGERQPAQLLPMLTDIPVIFSGSGKNRTTYPVAVGDIVLIAWCSSSTDRWASGGGIVDPEDERRHHISDAVAIVGLSDFAHVPTTAPTDAIVVHADTGIGVKLGGTAAANAVIKGTAYRASEDTFLSAFGVFITAVGGVPGMAAAAATMSAALVAHQAAIAGSLSLSTVVKVT